MSIQERDERQCWGSVQGEVLGVGVVLCSEGQVNVQGWRPRRRGVVLSSPHQLALLSQSPSRCMGVFPVVLRSSLIPGAQLWQCVVMCARVTHRNGWRALAPSWETDSGGKGGGETLGSVQSCSLGTEPTVTSLGTDEFSYLTLENNRMGWDLESSTGDSLLDQTFPDASPTHTHSFSDV